MGFISGAQCPAHSTFDTRFRVVPAPPSSSLVATSTPMNTRDRRHSVDGGRCESIEHQGPEAVRDGDLYVRQKSEGPCVTCGHVPEMRKDGDTQVMASEGRSKWHKPMHKLSLFRRHLKAYASPTTRGTVTHAQTKQRKDQIEPRENAEGAGENLGLDDIPKTAEWILLAACDERIRGRRLMKGGAGGPRA